MKINIRHVIGQIFSLLVLILLTGCTTVPQGQVFPGYTHDNYLKDLCNRHDISWDWDQTTQVITMKKNGFTGTALIDSSVVLIDEQQVELSEPIRLERGIIIVSNDFKRKVIDQLNFQEDIKEIAQIFEEPTVSQTVKHSTSTPKPSAGYYKLKKFKEIILDAGHGGKDPGAIGKSGLYEKDVVLDITKRLKRILESEGIRVHLTREEDRFITLQDRTAYASRTKADAFVSIHANSASKRSVHGVEVFSLRNLNQAEMEDEKRKNNRRILLSNLSIKADDFHVATIVDQMLYDYKQNESLKLASKVSRDLSRSLKTNNRGTKRAGFYVLRNTFIPAILVEVGFLTNPKEEKLLKSKKYRNKVARVIARSIMDFGEEK